MLNTANEALKQHQLSQTNNVDSLVSTLRELLLAYQTQGTHKERLDAIETAFDEEEPEELIKLCDKQLAFTNNNYLPFMLSLYRSKRSLLFDCIANMDLLSTTKDQSTLNALAIVIKYRRSRKENLNDLELNDEPLDLAWIPDKWLKLVTGKTSRDKIYTEVNRKYIELCLFTIIAQELKSGDLVINGSDKYDDFRDDLITWEEYHQQIIEYGELAGITTNPKALVEELKKWLTTETKKVDDKFSR